VLEEINFEEEIKKVVSSFKSEKSVWIPFYHILHLIFLYK
jgi:hypothetical protein